MDPAPERLICVAQELNEADLGRLRNELPAGTELILLNENLGFAAAANAGFRAAREMGAESVLLVNNDAVVKGSCLGRLLAEASTSDRIAVVGPAIALTRQPTRLWYAGGVHSHLFAFTRHRALRASVESLPPTADTEYVPGCCALFSMKAWEAIGEFREDFFMYYEDAEWGERARVSGWRLRYLGEVLCFHTAGVSSGQAGSLGLSENTAYFLGRNPLRFALDTASPALRISRVAGLMVVWNGYNLWRIIRSGRSSVGASYMRGLRDAIAGRMGPRPAP